MQKLTRITTEFFIPCVPLPYCRARVRVVHGHAMLYNKAEYTEIKDVIRLAGIRALKNLSRNLFIPNYNPVEMRITVVLQKPKKLSGKYKACVGVGKGDSDNFQKPVFDALEKIYYHNDGQIGKVSCEKVYTSPEYPESGFLICVKNYIQA